MSTDPTSGAEATPPDLPIWLPESALPHVIRIDVGVEGAWSETARPVWSPTERVAVLPSDLPTGPGLRPSLELYMDGGWIGVHCSRVVEGVHVLDREQALAWVRLVDSHVR